MKSSRGMGKVAASKKPKRKSRYAEAGEVEEPDLSYYGEAEPTPPREVDPELLRDLSPSRPSYDTTVGGSGRPSAFPTLPSRSLSGDIASAIKDVRSFLPSELSNLRVGRGGVGYEFNLGDNQTITPTIGKDRVGVTYKMGFSKGGKVKSASKRGDGCAQRGKTRGKMY